MSGPDKRCGRYGEINIPEPESRACTVYRDSLPDGEKFVTMCVFGGELIVCSDRTLYKMTSQGLRPIPLVEVQE